ncbi:MAG: hypothetical protein NT029_08290 [Armatimonadetes bacterium]|nr:hypothetical protein [Armatimonadota bacterium]
MKPTAVPDGASGMRALYRRLGALGLGQTYVRSVALPTGWDDSEAANPSTYACVLTLLARNLGLDIRSLQDAQAPLRWREAGETRFLKHGNVDECEFDAVKGIALRAAGAAAQGVTAPTRTIPSAQALRTQILSAGHQAVTLEALLDACWDLGIVVLCLRDLPPKAKKPTATVTVAGGRPVVVLCRKPCAAAWMLFWLAHEIGHVANGHLGGASLLIDADLDGQPSGDMEQEAHKYAVTLLAGEPDPGYLAPSRLYRGRLAAWARDVGRRDGVDPGFVVLHSTRASGGRYDVANNALKALEDSPDPVATVTAQLDRRLDWSLLTRDAREFLRRMAVRAS